MLRWFVCIKGSEDPEVTISPLILDSIQDCPWWFDYPLICIWLNTGLCLTIGLGWFGFKKFHHPGPVISSRGKCANPSQPDCQTPCKRNIFPLLYMYAVNRGQRVPFPRTSDSRCTLLSQLLGIMRLSYFIALLLRERKEDGADESSDRLIW